MSKKISKNRVIEATVAALTENAGGWSGGTHGGNGMIRGAAAAVGVKFPVVDEMTAGRRTHEDRIIGCDDIMNKGKGGAIDRISPEGDLISDKGVIRKKNGKASWAQVNITMTIGPVRDFIKAGGDIILCMVLGDVAEIEDGQTEIPMATGLMMRRASLKRIIEAQGDDAWIVGERGERFAFCRDDRGYARLCAYLPALPESVWFDSEFVPFNASTADLETGVSYESVDAKVIASGAGICVYDSNRVTVDGENAKAMTMKEAALLSAIIKSDEPVKGCRQTLKTVKQKLGHAGERIQNKRGKGYFLRA